MQHRPWELLLGNFNFAWPFPCFLSLQRSEEPAAGPPASTRSLQRWRSDAEHEAAEEIDSLQIERQELYQRSRDGRKKIVCVTYFSEVTGSTGRSELSMKEACELHMKHGGDLQKSFVTGESHRLIFFGPDSANELGEQPWRAPTTWVSEYDGVVETLLKNRKPYDILMFSDGRNLECLLKLLELTKKAIMKLPETLWIIYKPIQDKESQKKSVYMGMDNKEHIVVVFPVGFNRSRVQVQSRDQFTGAG